MLPSGHRMRRSADFAATVRDGSRAGRRTLVVHVVAGDASGALVGFVVPRSVGGAVVRNRVRRRLRALAAARLEQLGATRMVVRALPGAREASWRRLSEDFDGALTTATRRADERSSHE